MVPRSTSALAQTIRGIVPKRWERPHTRSLEAAYSARIRELITGYREAAEADILDILDFIGRPTPPRMDDPSDVIERTFAGLRVKVARMFERPEVRRMPGDLALSVDAQNRAHFRRSVRSVLGVDPVLSEPWLADEVSRFVRENVALIKSIPQESLNEIEQMLYRDAARHLSPTEMRQKIVERFGVTEARADLIATDQVLKFNGALTEMRQRTLGITRYIWQTAEDQRVRGNPAGLYPNAKPSHYALNGKIFSWDKPPVSGVKGERLPPGLAIRCRCIAIPVFDDILTATRGIVLR